MRSPCLDRYADISLRNPFTEDALMTDQSTAKQKKLEHPEKHFKKPADVLADEALSEEEKAKALNTWEQDARQMLTASNEGMPGSEEGIEPRDHHRLGEVVRAKEQLGKKAKYKPSH
jgi:hypothetical protein